MTLLSRWLLLTLSACLTACGAGVITGGLLGRGSGDNTAVESSITFDRAAGPLKLDADEFLTRSATLRNVKIPQDAELRAVLVWPRAGAPAVEVVQDNLLVERPSSEVAVLRWFLETDAIAASFVGRETEQDVDVQFVVRAVRGTQIEPLIAAPFRLLRKPQLELELNQPDIGISTVPLGGGNIVLRATNLPNPDARSLFVEFVTPNPEVGPNEPLALTRRGSNVVAEVESATVTKISVKAPANSFSGQVFVRVVHELAGRSTVPDERLFYEPSVIAAVPRRGSSVGGQLVNLVGLGIVPFDFDTRPPALNFRNLLVTFAKGGAEVQVPQRDLRPAFSSKDNLVLIAPPSPDGLPGPATITVEVRFPVPIRVQRTGIFSYGSSDPGLEPRGIALPRRPVRTAVGNLHGSSTLASAPVDLAMLSEIDRESFVDVFDSQRNGMFTRRGRAVSAIQRGDPAQLWPIDFAFGEFTGDDLADLLVLHGGEGGLAKHTVLRGVPDTLGKLRLVFHLVAIFSLPAPARLLVTDFAGDRRSDALICWRPPQTTRPRFLAQRPNGSFVDVVLDLPIEASEECFIGRLDDDAFDDVAFASGGDAASAKLHVAFGDAGPTFSTPIVVDLGGFDLTDWSVVGLHSSLDGPLRDLVVALRHADGLRSRLIVVRQDAARSFAGPHDDVPVTGAITHGMLRDIDADGTAELVLGLDGTRLELWKWDPARRSLAPIAGGGFLGPFDAIAGLDFGVASAPAGASPRGAVFVTHGDDLGGVVESRVTTLLVAQDDQQQARLVDPTGEVAFADPIDGIAVAELDAGAAPSNDVLVCSAGRLTRLLNDGLGVLAEHPGQPGVTVPPLLGATLRAVPRPAGATTPQPCVVIARDGRVGVLMPGADRVTFSGRNLLRAGSGDTLNDGTRLVVADVDADGIHDVVVSLVVDRAGGATDTTLLFLKGRASTSGFPFVVPDVATQRVSVPGAASLAVGELMAGVPRALEAALAVGSGSAVGVTTFELVDGAFAARGVVAGTAELAPRLVAATDIDGDGVDDVLVVKGTSNELVVFRNAGTAATPDGNLLILQTHETPLPIGDATAIRLADLDGDGLRDVVVVVRDAMRTLDHVFVGVMDGVGGLVREFLVPSERIGGAAATLDLGDLNGDAIADLALARRGGGSGAGDVLRLLFGSHR